MSEKLQRARTEPEKQKLSRTQLGISDTINLNLPAMTQVEVFNAIFKSLKEHILNEQLTSPSLNR